MNMIIFFTITTIILFILVLEESKKPYENLLSKNINISNIWKPIFAEYSLMFLISAIVSNYNKTSIFIIPIYFVIGYIIFYIWHTYAHYSNGGINEEHMIHHIHNFPKDDFFGLNRKDKPFYGHTPTFIDLLNPNKSMTLNLGHDGSLFIPLIILVLIGKFVFKNTNLTMLVVLIMYFSYGIFETAMHAALHVKNFEFEKYEWFRELRALHYQHHVDKKNFSIVNMFYDFIFGSLVL